MNMKYDTCWNWNTKKNVWHHLMSKWQHHPCSLTSILYSEYKYSISISVSVTIILFELNYLQYHGNTTGSSLITVSFRESYPYSGSHAMLAGPKPCKLLWWPHLETRQIRWRRCPLPGCAHCELLGMRAWCRTSSLPLAQGRCAPLSPGTPTSDWAVSVGAANKSYFQATTFSNCMASQPVNGSWILDPQQMTQNYDMGWAKNLLNSSWIVAQTGNCHTRHYWIFE